MGIVEKEGGLPVFDIDNLKKKIPTAETITWVGGKISANLPAVEGLTSYFFFFSFLPNFLAMKVTGNTQ